MSSKGVPWIPVHNYGCGWKECPECGPMIELEIEAKHRKKVANTFAEEASAVDTWQASERAALRPETQVISLAERREARGTQAKYRAVSRSRRSLSTAWRREAQSLLDEISPRRAYLKEGRATWESEVWLELLNPTKLIGKREQQMGLERRLSRAISRAQRTLQRRYVENKRYVLTLSIDESE
jgi:hypothetical protein